MSTYKILAMGDSVVWGQGLNPCDKFVNIVAQTIEAETDAGNVEVRYLAHSGAVVGGEARAVEYLYGEIPNDTPNIITQLGVAGGSYQDVLNRLDCDIDEQTVHKEGLRRIFQQGSYSPDLIIVDGGINDIGIAYLLAPVLDSNSKVWEGYQEIKDFLSRGGDSEFSNLVTGTVNGVVNNLLTAILSNYQHSKVIVTGYYPVFTKGSKISREVDVMTVLLSLGSNEVFAKLLRAVLLAKSPIFGLIQLLITAFKGDYKNAVIRRSTLWYSAWEQAMTSLVQELRRSHGNRIFFANPAFSDDNGAFAENPFLFVWQDSGKIASYDDLLNLQASDPQKKTRDRALQKTIHSGCISVDGSLDELFFRLASVGHPNPAGARAYAKKILSLIEEKPSAFGLNFRSSAWSDSVRLDKQCPMSPALASFNNKLFMAWKSNDNNDLFVASYADGTWSDSVRLDKQSSMSPALASFNNKLFMAWKSNDNNDLFVASYADGKWSDSNRLDKQSPMSPALASFNNKLFMAWKSNDNNDLFVASYADGKWSDSNRLDKQSPMSPALASFNNKLFMAWKSNDNNDLFVASYADGKWSDSVRLDKQSPKSPALASFNNKLFMAWKANDNDDLLVAYTINGDCWSLSSRLDKQSPKGPSLSEFNNKIFMAWKAIDNNDLFVASM